MQTNLPPWEHQRSTSGVGALAAHAIGKCWTPGQPLTSGGCSLWSATCNLDGTPGAPTFHLMWINGETKHIRLLQNSVKKPNKHVIKNILNNSNQVNNTFVNARKILFMRKFFHFHKLLQFINIKIRFTELSFFNLCFGNFVKHVSFVLVLILICFVYMFDELDPKTD